MSYVIRTTASLEMLLGYVAQVRAGLGAMPETAPLAAPWVELRDELRAARDARDDDRDALIAAQTKTRVLDAEWDDAVGDLSSHAFLSADKDAKKPPYVSLFGAVKAADAVQLGTYKATAFGEELIQKTKLELEDHPSLKAPLRRVEKAQPALLKAGEEREQAEVNASLHDVTRRKLIAKTERLIALSEVGILTAFPGRRDLVQAMLAPARATGRKRKKGEEPADDVEPVAEPGDGGAVDADDGRLAVVEPA